MKVSKSLLRAAGAMTEDKKLKEARSGGGRARTTKRVGLHGAEYPGRYFRAAAKRFRRLVERTEND